MMNEEIDVDELIADQKRHREEAEARPGVVDVDDLEAASAVKVVSSSSSPAPSPTLHTTTYDADELPVTKGHHTADPFAPREGKTLVWRDVNMTLVRNIVDFCLLSCV